MLVFINYSTDIVVVLIDDILDGSSLPLVFGGNSEGGNNSDSKISLPRSIFDVNGFRNKSGMIHQLYKAE